MNINVDIVARALDKAGQEPLTDEEIKTKDGTRWRVIKDFYLAVILEALSNTAWTSRKKRVRLEESKDENLTEYRIMYDLPADCAKPVSLAGEGEYLVEDGRLYTNERNAVLVYVSNGFTGKYKYEKADPEPDKETFDTGEYYWLIDNYIIADPQPASDKDFSADNYYIKTTDPENPEAWEYIKAEVFNPEETYYVNKPEYVKADTFEEGTVYYTRLDEDYYFYDEIKLDPQLSSYIETKLAADIVLKLTGNMQLYQMLFTEASIMETRAVKASVAHGHNKDKGDRWWGDILGMPGYEQEED